MSRPSMAEKESKITKSPCRAPCPVSATVTLLVPFVVKGFVNEVGPRRIGVTSYAVPSV